MYLILSYCALAIIIIYIIASFYIKIKFPFWNIQPVFHFYNLYYWFSPQGIISPELPEINKYINLFNIKTLDMNTIDDANLQLVCDFIKKYYLKNKVAEYVPTKNNIIEYLKSNNHPSFISIYNDKMLLDNASGNSEIIGVLSTRAINVRLKGQSPFTTYYADNLCVHPGYRSTGIAPKLIQTHYYNIRRYNKNVKTCLFKREGSMTAIVPLTTFYTYGFSVDSIKPNLNKIEGQYSHIEITSKNIQLLIRFIDEQTSNYDCVITPCLTNISNLLNTGNYFIYGLLCSNALIACYIFKDPSLLYSDDKTIECTTTLFNSLHSDNIFVSGFKLSLQDTREKIKTKYLLIEDNSNSNIIIKDLLFNGLNPFIKSPTAFFLYNYASYSSPSSSSFLFY